MLHFDPIAHKYWLGEGDSRVELPSVTTVLSAMGMIDTSQYRMKKLADGREIDPREFGTYVHSACHMDWKGTLAEDTLDAALLPYVEAFRAFRGAMGEDLKVLHMEEPGYHKIHKYAGTPDLVCKLNLALALIDIKTGAKAPWHGLQTAAYSMLRSQDTQGAQRYDRYALFLSEDGRCKLEPHKDRTDAGVFLSALACYNWRKNNGGIK
jgi:hypothetical protein